MYNTTVDEYFRIEEAVEVKHEYVEGVVYPMTGFTENHCLIIGNVMVDLMNRLDDTPCHVYSSHFRLKIAADTIYTYPDGSVVCEKPLLADGRDDVFLNPTVVYDVLSDYLEAFDRRKKPSITAISRPYRNIC